MTLIIVFCTPCSDYHPPASHLLAFAAWGRQPGSSPGVAPRDVNDLVMINPNCHCCGRRNWACDAGCWLGILATSPGSHHYFTPGQTDRQGSLAPDGARARAWDSPGPMAVPTIASGMKTGGKEVKQARVPGSCLAQVYHGKGFRVLFYLLCGMS